MENISQMHFDFKYYEKAFETWDENLPLYEGKMMMVISGKAYTEGYWIEALSNQNEEGDVTFYKSDAEVQSLKQRVYGEIALAKEQGRCARLTY